MLLTRLGCAVLVVWALATGFDPRDAVAAGPAFLATPTLYTAPPGFDTTSPVCKLGVFGAPVAHPDNQMNVLSFDPVNGDYFYTWLNLDSLSCSNACGLGTYGHVTAAHLVMSFPVSPETLVVSVGIVGVTPATCRYQNRNNVIYPAFDQILTWEGATNQPVDFTIPIPGDCRIEITALGNGQAFLEYNFKYSKYNTVSTRPRLVLQGTPVSCHTFVPVAFEQEDWFDNYSGGNPIMYADIEECLHVPVRPTTWGQLKQLYR